MRRVLAIDASALPAAIGMVTGEQLVSHSVEQGADTGAELARLLHMLVAASGPPDAVAVTVGPGSFTGIRASLALARGYAEAAGCPVAGVPLERALSAAGAHGRSLWIAVDARPGLLHLHDGVSWRSVPSDDVAPPPGPVAVAGPAAPLAAACLAARGADVMLTGERRPTLAAIAAAAAEARPAEPLYVDPPRTRAGPLRPPPA